MFLADTQVGYVNIKMLSCRDMNSRDKEMFSRPWGHDDKGWYANSQNADMKNIKYAVEYNDYVLDQFSHYVDTFRWTAAWYAVPCSIMVWFSSVPHVPAMISQGRIAGLPPPLTHWGRVTHICVSKLTIIGSDNGLSPDRRQAIIWTNAGLLFIRSLGTNFSETLIEILTFSFK